MRNWQALTGIGLIVVYSVVMVMTEGSAPFAWVTLAAGLGLVAVQARVWGRDRQVDRD